MSKKIIPLFIAAILVILSFMSVCSNATDIMYNTYHRRIYSETKSKNSSNDDNRGAKIHQIMSLLMKLLMLGIWTRQLLKKYDRGF